jgi:hypothetical protein
MKRFSHPEEGLRHIARCVLMISLVQNGFYGQKRRKTMAKKDILDEILAEKPVLSQMKEEDVILEP